MRLKKPALLNIGIDLHLDPLVTFSDSAGGITISGVERSRSRVSGSSAMGKGAPKAPDAITGLFKSGKRAGIAKNDVAGPAWHLFHGDAIPFLSAYPFGGSELVYCDPPYMRETRGPRDIYRCELDDLDHMLLLSILRRLPCRVMISGYWSERYAEFLSGWDTVQYQTMTRGGTPRTEWLWCNFPEPVALHDYTYLGGDFRARERIKRKKLRWVNKIRRMPLLERRALLAAIGQVDLDHPPSLKTELPAIAATSTIAGNGAPRRSPSPLRTVTADIAVSGVAAGPPRRNRRG